MNKFFLLLFLSVSCLAFGQKKTGQVFIDSLVRELPKMKDDTIRAKALLDIGYLYTSLDPIKSKDFTDRGLALSKQIRWKNGEAAAYNNYGILNMNNGDHPAALSEFFKSLRLYEEVGFTKGIGAISGNIGTLYSKQNNLIKALEYYFIQLNAAVKQDDKQLIISALMNIGVSYHGQSKFEETLKYFEKANKMAEELGDKSAIGKITGYIGGIYGSLGQYALSLTYLKKSLRMAEQTGNTLSFAENLVNIGHCYLSIAEDSTKVLQDSLIPSGKQAILSLAASYLKRGIVLADEIGNASLKAFAYQSLSLTFASQGNYKASLETYQQADNINDSLFNIANSNEITNIEAKRAVELKDKDIRIAELEVEKKRNERGLFIGGIILLLIAMVFIIRNIQRRKLQEKQAAQLKTMIDTQESERKRISRDLHDDIGTKLSALGLFLSSMKDKASQSGNSEIISLAQSSQQFIKEAVHDLRELLLDLSPSVLEDFGYTVAVEGLVNKINETRLIHFNLVTFGMKDRLSKDYDLALYRITQELVNNVLKHSGAKKVTLQIGRRENLVILMIDDDGKGFEIADHQEGYGLKNLSSRTALLQGKMTIDTAPGKGTSVLIEIPYSE